MEWRGRLFVLLLTLALSLPSTISADANADADVASNDSSNIDMKFLYLFKRTTDDADKPIVSESEAKISTSIPPSSSSITNNSSTISETTDSLKLPDRESIAKIQEAKLKLAHNDLLEQNRLRLKTQKELDDAQQKQNDASLTPEQKLLNEEREKFMKEHKGHENQHAQMALILMFGMVFSQFLLMYWKKNYARSFQIASVIGLWLVPPAIGLSAGNYRYFFVWVLFSLLNTYILKRALFETPMQSSTPRLVYKWFSIVYKISVAVGAVGYFFTLVAFLHIPYLVYGASEKSELSIFQV